MAGAGRHLFVLHAEENALYQAIAATGQWPLQHAMAFVTHRPCSRCVVRLFHNGVGLVTYLHDQLDDQQRRDTELAQEELGIEIVRYGS
jgi:deoxycytidylate deaminase